MDAVVVENEMDPASLRVRPRHELIEEVREQEAVFAVPLDPCELVDLGIESTGEVALLIAYRSADVHLLSGQRPVWTNRGIEVIGAFVEVQSDLVRRKVVDQPSNRSQSPRPTPCWPRAVDSRFGPVKPNPQPSQEPTHCGDAHSNAVFVRRAPKSAVLASTWDTGSRALEVSLR
jgi:hypothetical protein